MLATMRIKRAMEKSGIAYGGKIIESDKVHHLHADNQEELVDLILFERETSLDSYQKSPFFSLMEQDINMPTRKAA